MKILPSILLVLLFPYAAFAEGLKVITLENGLRLVVKERPKTRTAALQVWVKVGSRDELEGQQGVSHLLAHVILKGTEHLAAEKIAEEVASLGGQISGGTSQEYSQYAVDVPDTGYPEMLRLLLEVMTHPAFRDEDIEKERQVVLTEIGRVKDIPESGIEERALREVFKGHPMANPIRGEEKSLKKISRDLLIQHYQTYYIPANMVVVAVGNVKTEEVIKIVCGRMEVWECGKVSYTPIPPYAHTLIPPLSPSYPEQTQHREVSLGSILIQQAKMLLAIRAMGIQESDRPAMEVLSSLIQLRLFDSIRETRGLAYVVSSEYRPLSDTGVWKIYVEARGEAESRTKQVLFEELKKIRMAPMEEVELKEAKEYLKGRFVRAQETNRGQALYLGERVLFDSLESEESYFSRIDQVTWEDVQQVAIHYIQDTRYNLVVLKPLSFFGKLGFLLKQVF